MANDTEIHADILTMLSVLEKENVELKGASALQKARIKAVAALIQDMINKLAISPELLAEYASVGIELRRWVGLLEGIVDEQIDTNHPSDKLSVLLRELNLASASGEAGKVYRNRLAMIAALVKQRFKSDDATAKIFISIIEGERDR